MGWVVIKEWVWAKSQKVAYKREISKPIMQLMWTHDQFSSPTKSKPKFSRKYHHSHHPCNLLVYTRKSMFRDQLNFPLSNESTPMSNSSNHWRKPSYFHTYLNSSCFVIQAINHSLSNNNGYTLFFFFCFSIFFS